MTEILARDAKICQSLAEAFWNIATSENREIAVYNSAPYRQTERAFISAVRAVYGLSLFKARRVRDLLSEYGPHDSLQGTSGRGIASYVEFASDRRNSSYHY